MKERYDSLDKNDKLIWNFRDIGHTMRQTYEGKGSQKRILIVLDEAGVITQSQLTQQLGIQPCSASEVLGKLEGAGMITRTPSETDRRTTNVQLTGAGKAAAEEAKRKRAQRHEQMFSCFTKEEKDQLLALLEKVNDSWDHLYRENGSEQRVADYRKHRRL